MAMLLILLALETVPRLAGHGRAASCRPSFLIILLHTPSSSSLSPPVSPFAKSSGAMTSTSAPNCRIFTLTSRKSAELHPYIFLTLLSQMTSLPPDLIGHDSDT